MTSSWPSNCEAVEEAIALHKGKYTVYVGEECCAEFVPDDNYEVKEVVEIPCWPNLLDRMYIYKRK